MTDRPYVLLSAAMSLDGYIDDASPQRLVLSDATDLDRVDDERARVDAILVGANTVRRDDPRLLVRSDARRAARVAAGRPADPVKVTITGSGDLDPQARFFTTGDGEKIVYSGVPVRFPGATVVELTDLDHLLADLHDRGVRRLMVEGGTAVHTMFLTADRVDEVQLAVAPFLVRDAAAPRFVGPGAFPRRLRLLEARPVGDLVLLRYGVGKAG